jgi:hypothetical protein
MDWGLHGRNFVTVGGGTIMAFAAARHLAANGGKVF